jgi:ATP synthase protein I
VLNVLRSAGLVAKPDERKGEPGTDKEDGGGV